MEEINQEKRKDDTSLNSCKGCTSLKEERKTSAVRIVEGDDSGSEGNNEMVTDTDESDDGSVKSSPP